MSKFDYSSLDLRRPIYVIGEEIWAKTSLNWNQALEKAFQLTKSNLLISK